MSAVSVIEDYRVDEIVANYVRFWAVKEAAKVEARLLVRATLEVTFPWLDLEPFTVDRASLHWAGRAVDIAV